MESLTPPNPEISQKISNSLGAVIFRKFFVESERNSLDRNLEIFSLPYFSCCLARVFLVFHQDFLLIVEEEKNMKENV